MTVVAVATIVFGRDQSLVVPVVLPLLMGSVIITELLSAAILLSQFLELRYPSLAFVGAAYLFSGLLVIPYLLTFPQVFSATGLFHANEEVALTLWALWHFGFPILVLAYVLVQRRFGFQQIAPVQARRILFGIVASCVAAAAAALFLTTQFRAALPALIQSGHFTLLAQAGLLPAIGLVDLAAFFALVTTMRGRTVTPLWLSLAVLASLYDAVMGLLCHRYSFGWYTGKVFAVASSSFILGAFIYEFIGLSKRLGFANRELRRLNAIEQQQAQERIEHLASHDALTGLTNRSRLRERLGTSISAARRLDNQLALLVVNIDHFKDINDAYGRPFGDHVLVETASRLSGVARSDEPISHLGGDEFGLIANGIRSPSETEIIAHRLRRLFKTPFVIGEREVNLSASVGIALYPDDGNSAETLLEHAEAAVNHAKRDGGDGQEYYNQEIAERIRSRRIVHDGLQHALERGEFILHFQPLLDLHSGRIETAEALIRWNHPDKGLIPPAEFIPVAEDTGLMIPIGKLVLETALRETALCRTDGQRIRVAVNVSARQFQDPTFFRHLRSALEKTNAKAASLEIEVTESVAIADSVGNACLQQCKELGVGIALDDFGTHYSSLAYLKQLPVDTIKIDRSFVRDLPSNQEDAAIVKAIIALGKNLDRHITAEGVESAEQLEWLRQAGCDTAQGFFIAKPMPIDELIAWMAEASSKLRRAV